MRTWVTFQEVTAGAASTMTASYGTTETHGSTQTYQRTHWDSRDPSGSTARSTVLFTQDVGNGDVAYSTAWSESRTEAGPDQNTYFFSSSYSYVVGTYHHNAEGGTSYTVANNRYSTIRLISTYSTTTVRNTTTNRATTLSMGQYFSTISDGWLVGTWQSYTLTGNTATTTTEATSTWRASNHTVTLSSPIAAHVLGTVFEADDDEFLWAVTVTDTSAGTRGELMALSDIAETVTATTVFPVQETSLAPVATYTPGQGYTTTLRDSFSTSFTYAIPTGVSTVTTTVASMRPSFPNSTRTSTFIQTLYGATQTSYTAPQQTQSGFYDTPTTTTTFSLNTPVSVPTTLSIRKGDAYQTITSVSRSMGTTLTGITQQATAVIRHASTSTNFNSFFNFGNTLVTDSQATAVNWRTYLVGVSSLQLGSANPFGGRVDAPGLEGQRFTLPAATMASSPVGTNFGGPSGLAAPPVSKIYDRVGVPVFPASTVVYDGGWQTWRFSTAAAGVSWTVESETGTGSQTGQGTLALQGGGSPQDDLVSVREGTFTSTFQGVFPTVRAGGYPSITGKAETATYRPGRYAQTTVDTAGQTTVAYAVRQNTGSYEAHEDVVHESPIRAYYTYAAGFGQNYVTTFKKYP